MTRHNTLKEIKIILKYLRIKGFKTKIKIYSLNKTYFMITHSINLDRTT